MEHLLEEGEYESLGKYLKQFVAEELGEVRSIYSDSPIINAVFHNKMSICKEKGIARETDEVNIFVENGIEQSVLAENQLLETTKEKKDQHGMGHLIVEEQVKRLGGMVEYYEDEMFCAHVYLPM